MKVFHSAEDYRTYRSILWAQACRYKVDVWAYCLMPNHVHLVAAPTTSEGLALAIGSTHQRFALKVNGREGWAGHLWQQRFYSFPMDEFHLLAAVRYVLLNPVRAGLAEEPEDWPFSSIRAHLGIEDDPLVCLQEMASRIEHWQSYLKTPDSQEFALAIRSHTKTGRPLGSEAFIDSLERQLERSLRARKPGPKPLGDK